MIVHLLYSTAIIDIYIFINNYKGYLISCAHTCICNPGYQGLVDVATLDNAHEDTLTKNLERASCLHTRLHIGGLTLIT